MQEVFVVKEADKSKAEDVLRKDDVVGRQSITIRLASNMGLEKEGYFIIINGSEESIKKAEDLIKEIAKKYKNKEKVLEKIKEEEDSAAEGLGAILGG